MLSLLFYGCFLSDNRWALVFFFFAVGLLLRQEPLLARLNPWAKRHEVDVSELS